MSYDPLSIAPLNSSFYEYHRRKAILVLDVEHSRWSFEGSICALAFDDAKIQTIYVRDRDTGAIAV
jgi:hypothetical protein